MSKSNDSNRGKWIFFGAVFVLFIGMYFYSPKKGLLILVNFKKLILQILPVLFFVYAIIIITNYYLDKDKINKYMGEDAGLKAWLISILSGIISAGPVYMWYPLMKDLQNKGVKNRFLVTFLYNRGIKLQWLPMLILYFGLKYSLLLMIVMAIISVPTGIITEKLINKHK